MKLLWILIISCLFSITESSKSNLPINITWVNKLDEDFSFAKKQSIECEAWCYEWAGTNKIFAKQKSKDTIFCYTATNVATHCSLNDAKKPSQNGI